jgi:RNA polymerase sigma-70 factor
MDMRGDNRPASEAVTRAEYAKLLGASLPALEQWCVQAGTKKWGISKDRFTAELARSAAARFRGNLPSEAEFQAYLGTLHLEDLALACACIDGVEEAWEQFVSTFRGYLRACAGAMLKRSATSPEAEELADSLFAELYGVSEGKRGSLLKYFHGRSSLKTWLRAVLAQRHVDKIRAGRRFEELGDEDGNDGAATRSSGATATPMDADPHRQRYLGLFTSALQTALNNLHAQDAERLRMYYAEEKKLAEIGRELGEHESSVSRHLEKARRNLREAVEGILRAGSGPANGQTKAQGLSDAEIGLCFEYAAEDAPIDLDKLFSKPDGRAADRNAKGI